MARRTTDLQTRGIPVSLRERVRRRAGRKGVSMTQYVIERLQEDLALPTIDEWLDERGITEGGSARYRHRAADARPGGTANGGAGTADPLVLDASAAVDLLAGLDVDSAIDRALRERTIVVPAPFDSEVYGGLRRLDRRGLLPRGLLDTVVPVLARFPARRVPLAGLMARAHALRARFSPADSFYVALAQRVEGEFVTCDRTLAEACDDLVAVRLIATR